MTYEEAIKEAEIQFDVYESMILYNKDFEPKNDNSNYEHKIEFLKIAIGALEKQVPKKPIEYEDKYYGCPTCGNVTMMKWEQYPDIPMSKIYGLPYCLGCGQVLDWSEEE